LETQSWRTIPNLITAIRILMIVPFVHFVGTGQDRYALIIFFIAGISDSLDGALARWLNQTSKFGRLVDPVADKFLAGIAYTAMSLFRNGRSAVPVWVMIAVIARDVLILLGCWVVYRVAHDSSFRPTIAGKINTVIELGTIGVFLGTDLFPALTGLLPYLYAIMAVSIVISAAGYARQGFRMLRRAGPEG
jgi:cardiolipin synthase